MKKRVITFVMLCIVIVASYFYAYIDCNSYIYDRNADTATFYGTGVLTENDRIEQTFAVKENTIDGINVKVSLAGDVQNVVLHCCILNDEKEEVAKTEVSATELQNNKFNRIRFSTIENTRGKQYMLVLQVENADEQNGVSFYIEPTQQENQRLSIDDNDTAGTLVVRMVSHRFDVETFVVLLGMITFVSAFMKMLYKMFK